MKKMFIHFQSIYPPILFGILSFIFSYFLIIQFGNVCDICTEIFIILMTIGIPILFIDAVQRFRMYQSAYEYIKFKKGKDIDKLLLLEQFSWCTRESVKAACHLYSDELYDYAYSLYKKRGFRYYHIAPVGTFTRNSPLFKKSFWISAIFHRGRKNYFKILDK